MTGLGAYCYIVWAIHLRRVLNRQQDEYVMVWPNLWTLPEIVSVSEVKEKDREAGSNGRSINGKAK